MSLHLNCPCHSNLLFEHCCKPVIYNDSATSPEQLMRSRYSAFATNNTDYIFQTFSKRHRTSTLKAELNHSSHDAWVALCVINATKQEVEFKAYRKESNNKIHILHERSSFVLEHDRWRYDSGVIIQNSVLSVSRNSLCFCSSGKKVKRCCMR